MKKNLFSFLSLTAAVTILTLTLGAGVTFAAHPEIPLYTYEEIGMQLGGLDKATAQTMPDGVGMFPVYISDTGVGMPYSPKMTCGNCHNGQVDLQRWDGAGDITDADGIAITAPLVSYNDMTTQAFHSELGAQEWQDAPYSGSVATDTKSSQPGKPWSQTNGMWGKW